MSSRPAEAQPRVGFAVGVGLTNACNLACAHCYRDVDRVDNLSLDDIKNLCDSIPVRAINLGTGENALHPQFKQIISYLKDRDVKLTITSNGYTISVLSDEEVRFFHDVEFSLDFPTEREQDAFRGEGNWRLVEEQMQRCCDLGVSVTVTAVMMSTNYNRMSGLARLAASRGAMLRINAYQPVKTDAFTLSYEQFWEGYRRLFAESEIVICNEPIVRALLGLGGSRCGCGIDTVRLSPRGEVLPCVYWPGEKMMLADLRELGAGITQSEPFAETRVLPEFCQRCEFAETCGGGCPGRRMLRGRLDQPDEYCPFTRGDTIILEHQIAASADLPKGASACTTIVKGGAR
jgi:radical SAM protein with 4Fe4S-binding SPASM domain